MVNDCAENKCSRADFCGERGRRRGEEERLCKRVQEVRPAH